ncbi:MAG: hypothetical protein SCARUB_00289 [Candidatus Scalindua rubra]|uniref:SpoVT-AbrB domain-containing protein n=1 Tax=Candidatus Scalindua rubra TaxID=1872076 RepID=A0A1E3XI14_9BACT|nr:MAG: hypothetical protein SCARUB_00289 [Candidatus Scalindua rubra]
MFNLIYLLYQEVKNGCAKETYTAEYLNDGHLSIPKEIADRLSLKTGKKLRVIVEASRFDKNDILGLFGIWKDKSAEEIKIFRDIIKQRRAFQKNIWTEN